MASTRQTNGALWKPLWIANEDAPVSFFFIPSLACWLEGKLDKPYLDLILIAIDDFKNKNF